MTQFISGPPIGPESLGGLPPVGTPGSGGKEVYFDSSGARAAYYDQVALGNQGTPEQIEASSFSPSNEVENQATGPSEPPLDDAIMRAAAEGKPLTPDLIARLPSPFPIHPPPSRSPAMNFPPPIVHLNGTPVPTLTGLTVRVGRGIVASVNFQGGEPTAKHWRRLLKFIEIAAEESDDEAPEDPPPFRTRAAERISSQPEVPAPAERRARRKVKSPATPSPLVEEVDRGD